MEKITPNPMNAQVTSEVSSKERALKKAEMLAARALKGEKDVEKATAGFESLLLNEMLKAMWESVETTGLLGEDSNEAQIYRDMLNQAIADNSAKGRGIGIKKYLKSELAKDRTTTTVKS